MGVPSNGPLIMESESIPGGLSSGCPGSQSMKATAEYFDNNVFTRKRENVDFPLLLPPHTTTLGGDALLLLLLRRSSVPNDSHSWGMIREGAAAAALGSVSILNVRKLNGFPYALILLFELLLWYLGEIDSDGL